MRGSLSPHCRIRYDGPAQPLPDSALLTRSRKNYIILHSCRTLIPEPERTAPLTASRILVREESEDEEEPSEPALVDTLHARCGPRAQRCHEVFFMLCGTFHKGLVTKL